MSFNCKLQAQRGTQRAHVSRRVNSLECIAFSTVGGTSMCRVTVHWRERLHFSTHLYTHCSIVIIMRMLQVTEKEGKKVSLKSKQALKPGELVAPGRRRCHQIATGLSTLYPDAASELNFVDEYQLTVAVMLSAQCTDKKVNEVTPALFGRFPCFKELARARISQIERIIRPVNYYKTKARHLIKMAKMLSSSSDGKLPRTHDELVELPGIGRKTANVILTELKAAHTMPVDTHVFRVSKRLGLTQGSTPRRVEEDLMSLFDPILWQSLHHWLILHGRRVCKAQRPLCGECPLRSLCPSARLPEK
jgi:endonuclease III